MIGTTLSHFRVTAKLGQGGMGEVYRAEDTKLGREVALKVLPDIVASDPERLARFEREARVLASLNHPHIAGIHQVEEADGKQLLVMELVEGEDLSQRLARGAIPLAEALPIALQIAEALEAAHDKGVIHRDLKPANVKVTEDGEVKVLDFGLAKALAPDPISGEGIARDISMSPTLTQAMTGAGMLLGTAGYMSPEQARGKPVDRRGDIWAFGCVLYEMLTGRRTFDGETVTDVLGAIVHKEPDLGVLPVGVPHRIRRLLEQCLEKDANRRLQAVGDARIAIQEWLENPVDTRPEEVVSRRMPWWSWAAMAIVGLLGLLAGRLLLAPAPVPEPVRRFAVDLSTVALAHSRGAATVVSPDGRNLVFVEGVERDLSLRLRPLDRFETTLLFQGEWPNAPHQPFFSPDGKWVAFMTANELKKMPVTGGSPIRLAETDNPRGGSWSLDGTIVFAPNSGGGLALVPAAGGEVEPLTEVDPGISYESHRWPQWLPGGKAVLFTVVTNQGPRLEVVDVATRERQPVQPNGAYGRYLATGHVLFVDNSALFALPYDAARLQVTGSPMPLLEGIASEQEDGEAQFDVSNNGVLVYMPGSDVLRGFDIAWADRTGQLEPLWEETGFFGTPRLSPDGKRLALSMVKGDDWDVWVYDIERDVATRITFGPTYDADGIWSPDGRWIAFASDRDASMGMYRKRSDGTGEAEVLIAPGEFAFPAPLSWSPDGQRIAFLTPPDTASRTSDIYFYSVEDGTSEAYLASPFDESDAFFSPDGRWLAYTSDESGRMEVYVRSLEGAGRWQITDGFGAQPLWSHDGKELFFRNQEGLMAVPVETDGDEFRAGKPQRLFGEIFGGPRGVSVPGYLFYDYDIAADGQHFVVFPRASGNEETNSRVHIVTGWFEELRSLTEAVGN